MKHRLACLRRQHERVAANAIGRRNVRSEIGSRAAEDAGHGVVVFHGKGIELVIVTASAGHRLGEHGASDGVDLLVDDVGGKLARIRFLEVLGAQRQEAGCNKQPGSLGVRIRRQQVASHLFDEEAIVGHVGIHGVDDVVAITPGVRKRDVRFLAARFGIASDVEPVPAPAFAELLRGQKGIGFELEGLIEPGFLHVRQKPIECGGRGGQADEIKV